MRHTRHRDIIVPCEGQGHKVRLAGGLRFLARARCPKCRSPVDPARWRRLVRLVSNLRRPASENAGDRVVWAASLAMLGLSVVVVVLFRQLADRWWPATLLLFGPRWVLLIPLPFLALFAVVRDRTLLVPLAASAALIVGPVMGFHTGWRALLTRPDPERDITIATFNVRSGLTLRVGPYGLMDELGADVAAFQECGHQLQVTIREALVRDVEPWYAWTGESLCLLSRLPIIETRVMPADVIQEAGGSGLVASHVLEGKGGRFLLTNVHLETPRDGLELIRTGRVGEGIDVLKHDAFLRSIEHRQASAFANSPGPHIVVGDFNSPSESRIFRAAWNGSTDAFSVAGFGLGGTRLNGWIRARIDHILVSDSWKVVKAWVGEDEGSDHLPFVATVRRR